MGIDVSKIGSTLVDQFVGFSSEKIYPNNFLSAKAVGEGPFGRNINDGYGASIAISENYAVVGVPNQSYDYQGENLETGAGAVYVYERDANTWVYMQKLSIPDAYRATSDSFGFAVSVEGDTVVVGSPGSSTNEGSAFVYQYTTKGFVLTSTLIPSGTNAVGTADKFGSSVAINNNMIVVGAPNQSYDNSGTNLLANAGAAWVFTYDDMSLSWNQVQKIAEEGDVRTANDELGYSVAANSSRLVVGAPNHPYINSGEEYLVGAGAAYIWDWNTVTGTWEFDTKITPSNRAQNANFGSSVALDGNTVVVSSIGYLDSVKMKGAISVFTLTNNKWVEEAFLQPSMGSALDTSYTYTPGLDIGYGSAISINGNTLIVGMPSAPLSSNGTKTSSGAVAIYTGPSWSLGQVITNPHFGTSLATTTDNFGSSVNLGTNVMVVGFPNDSYDETDTNAVSKAGSAYVYQYNNTWTLLQKIVGWGRDRNNGDLAGASVCYQDGFAFIGAPGHSYDINDTNYLAGAGAVYVWQWSGSDWTYSQKITPVNRHAGDGFGSTISGDTGIVVIGAPTASYDSSNTDSVSNSGTVFVLSETNGIWSITQQISASSRNINDGFGSSISVNGTDMVIGMPTNSTSTDGVYGATYANCGAAEFFKLVNSSWVFSSRVYAGDNRSSGDKFGTSVSLNSGIAIIGAPYHDFDSDGLHSLSNAGAAWIYAKDATTNTWSQNSKITGWGQDRNANDYMGWSTASDNGTIVVGVPNHAYDVNGRNYIAGAGSVLVFIWYNGGWFFQQKLVAETNRLAGSYFGFSVDISGDTIIVGAPECGTYGTAYVFDRSYGVWSQTTELPFVPFQANYATTFFKPINSYGASVAIDKDNIVIGFPHGYTKYHDKYFSGTNSEGCAFAYSKINDVWTLETTLTSYGEDIGIPNGAQPGNNLGITVSVKDGIAIVGSPMQGYDDSGANPLTNSGAVYIYRRTANGSSFVWKFDQKLAGGANDRFTNDQFGSSAAVYGNTIAISAINHPYDANDTNYFAGAGAVYVWTIDNGSIDFQQKITAVGTNARNTNAYFGTSISLIDDMIAIGAPGTTYDVNGFNVGANYGAVFVFVRTNNNWAIQEWISSPQFDTNKQLISPSISGAVSQYFGKSIALNQSEDVIRLLIGSPNYTVPNDVYTGAAFSYIYDKLDYVWKFDNLFENPYMVSNSFGTSVGLQDDIAIVGCPAATNINSYNNFSYNPGAASVYLNTNNSWNILSEIFSPNTDNMTGDKLGSSIAIDGNTMVVGAPNNTIDSEGSGYANAGAAYVFNWNGTEWLFAKKLSSPGYYRNSGDLFGTSVGVSGDAIVVGAPGASDFGNKNSSTPTTDGLIRYYPLNGNLKDSTGNGVDLIGPGTYGESLPDGTSTTLFNNNSTHIGDNVKPVSQISVSIWVNYQALPYNWSAIIGQFNQNRSGTNLWDFYMGVTPQNTLYAATTTSSYSNLIFNEIGISANTWYNICIVIDSVNKVFNFYINGQKYSQTFNSSDLSYFLSNDTTIGQANGGAFNTFDARIYDRALSDVEVSNIYNQYTASNITNAGALYTFKKGAAKTKRTPRYEILSSDTTWTVPSTLSDTSVKVSMWGGAGGSATINGSVEPGGTGGFVSLRVPVKEGDILSGIIGQSGGANGGLPGVSGDNLYKGGQGQTYNGGTGGSGGSASALQLNSRTIAVAGGGAGSYCAASGSNFAPPVPVALANQFTTTTSGQDAITGTSYSLAGGGGGYLGGVTGMPVTGTSYMVSPASGGLSWVDDEYVSFYGTSINSWVVDGAGTSGYNGVAGSVSGATSNNGLIVIEWFEDQVIYDYVFDQQIIPTGTNAHNSGDNFGYSVDIKGTEIIAGAPYHDYDETGSNMVSNSGAAWIFELGTSWEQTQKLTGEGTNSRNANDWFGFSVSIDDSFAIVGAPQHGYDDYNDNFVSNNGAAWVFEKTNSTWTSVSKLIEFGRDKNTGDKLGSSIACDGLTCVVGSPSNSYDNSLDASGTASYTNLNYMANSGAAYIWEWNSTSSSWDFKQKIVASDRFAGEQFGSMVSISNEKILIGSKNTNLIKPASAYLFEKTGTYPTAWKESKKFSNNKIHNYGNSVAIDQSTIAIAGATSSKIIPYANFINGDSAVLGTGDFTVEAIVDYTDQLQTFGNQWTIVSSSKYQYHIGGGAWGIYISFVTGNLVIDNGTDQTQAIINYGQNHIAWTRTNGTSTLWLNGKSMASFADTTNYSDTNVLFRNTTNITQYGRVTAGTALYTSNFTAPSLLTQDDNTSIIYSYSELKFSLLDIYDFTSNEWNITASFYDGSTYEEGYGSSIALDSTHGIVVVGAPTRTMDETNANPVTNAGAVFVYTKNEGTWASTQILANTGVDSSPGDKIGSAVSADGNVLAVASYNHSYDDKGTNFMAGAGAVWIWRYFGTTPTWNLEQKIIPSDRAAGDNFGYSLSISNNTLIVGAPAKNNNAGSAYIFTRPATTTDGSVNCWYETIALNPTGTNASMTGDKFGYSVNVQESTSTAIVGAPYHSYDTDGSNLLASAGAAWSFKNTNETWEQDQKLIAENIMNGVTVDNARNANDLFGISVGLKDNSLIIGATGHQYDVSGTNPLVNAGAAFLYMRTDNTQPWSAITKLAGDSPERNPSDQYGFSVASTADTIVIGSPNQSYDGNGLFWQNNAGAVYVWVKGSSGWTLQQKLSAQDGSLDGNILREVGDNFGYSVAISGDTLVVGIPNRSTDATGKTAMTNAGAIMVFKRRNGVWTKYGNMIQGSDTAAGDTFGDVIDFDGKTIAVGVPLHSLDSTGANSLSHAGAVYLFTDSGTAFTQEAKITPTGTNARNANDNFGYSISIKDSLLIVGSPYHSYDDSGQNFTNQAGAAWIFTKSSNIWTQMDKISDFTQRRSTTDAFGSTSYVFSDTYLVVGAPGFSYDYNMRNYASNAGAVYVFTRNGSAFTYMQMLTPIGTNMRNAGDAFGTEVAISGKTIVASSPLCSFDSKGAATAGNTGLLFVFDFNGKQFVQTTVLEETGTNANVKGDNFGYSIAIDGNFIIASSIAHPYDANGANVMTGAGAAWIFYKDPTKGWVPASKLVPSGNNARNAGDNFGYDVDIDGTAMTAVVSSIGHTYDAAGLTSVIGSGAAWAFSATKDTPTVWTQVHKLVPTGTEKTSTDNFGSMASYNTAGYLAVSDQSTTDSWYENSIEGTGSVNIFKSSIQRTGVTLDGSSAYMDVSAVAKSITDTTWSISTWMKSTSTPSSSITHNCLYSVKHGDRIMRIYATPDNYIRITYGLTRIDAKISLQSLFDNNWHNLIVSGLGATETSDITVYIDGHAISVTAYTQTFFYPTDYVGFYSMDGIASDSTHTYGDITNATFGDASTLQTHREGISITGSIIPSIEKSFITDKTTSLSFWVNASQATASTGNTALITQLISSDGTVDGTHFLLNVSCNNKGQFFVLYNNSTAVTSSVALVPSTWYHVVVMIDPVNSKLSISVNNTLTTGTLTTTGSSTDTPILFGSAGTYTNDTKTGMIPNYSNFVGLITDLKIYNRTLTTDEITYLYKEFVVQPVDNNEATITSVLGYYLTGNTNGYSGAYTVTIPNYLDPGTGIEFIFYLTTLDTQESLFTEYSTYDDWHLNNPGSGSVTYMSGGGSITRRDFTVPGLVLGWNKIYAFNNAGTLVLNVNGNATGLSSYVRANTQFSLDFSNSVILQTVALLSANQVVDDYTSSPSVIGYIDFTTPETPTVVGSGISVSVNSTLNRYTASTIPDYSAGKVTNNMTTRVDAGIIPAIGDKILVGAGYNKDGSVGELFTGVISDVAVINGPVSASEAKAILTSGKNSSITGGIVGNWLV